MLALISIALIAAAPARAADRRPDWVERESGRWPREMYLTGVGSADERAAAEDRARAEIARVFTAHVSSALVASETESSVRTDRGTARSEQISVTDETRSTTDKVLEGVEIAEVWQDPQTRRTFALAVLDRQEAAARLDARLEAIGQQAAPLRRLLGSTDKAAALSAALGLLRQERDRQSVEKELRIVLPSHASRPSAAEDGARELLSRTSVRLTITGDESEVVRSALAGALGAVGLSLRSAEGEPDLIGEATVARQNLGVRDGWHWARASVALVLRDAASSRVVLNLSESERGASRAADEADRRVLARVSEKLRNAVSAALVSPAADP